MYTTSNGALNIKKIAIHIFIFFVLVILLSSSLGSVKAGERGVKLRFGAVVGVVQEGLYGKIPFIENVVKLDVKTQKHQLNALSYSKDLQSVDAAIALNYHLNPESVELLWKEIGRDYEERIIDPAIQESVKAATAKFTAQELIDERPKLKEEIKTELFNRLDGRHLVVEDFSIVNFDFSDVFEASIEKKQVAQQDALTAKNKLEQVKYEAEQRIAQATAEAEAIKIQAEAITVQGGANYVELKRVEKWDGRYPSTMLGGATPLLNIK